jgi:hypothetical protein
MEHLEIKGSPFNVIKTGIGILNIVAAVTLFAVYFNDKDKIPVITSVLIAFSGVYFVTNGFGLERSWFKTVDNFLIVKWADKLNPARIHDASIEKISLERTRIVIYQRSRKPLKLNLAHLE